MVLLQRLVLYCGIGKLVCEIATLLGYRTPILARVCLLTHTTVMGQTGWSNNYYCTVPSDVGG